MGKVRKQSLKSILKTGLAGKKRSRKGNWGTWEQRLWKATEPNHPFNN